MAEPHLPSLTIEGFRGFKKLELRKLGHVNLLVGKNGVGKSSVLDAVRLYATDFAENSLKAMADERDELWDPSALDSFRHLFYGRPELRYETEQRSLQINDLSLSVVKAKKIYDNGIRGGYDYRITSLEHFAGNEIVPALLVREAEQNVQFAPIVPANKEGLVFRRMWAGDPKRRHRFMPTEGLSSEQFKDLWYNINLGDEEVTVNSAISAILPQIQRISLVGEGPARRVMARSHSKRERVPLRSFGEGTYRIASIALAMVTIPDGILLIDEFESGLHYSILEKLWAFVFKVSREMSVQVFATTHSEDCVRAFAIAADKDKESLGIMTKLVDRSGRISARQLMEEDVLAGVEGLLEMR